MDPIDFILLGVVGFFVFMIMKNTGSNATTGAGSSTPAVLANTVVIAITPQVAQTLSGTQSGSGQPNALVGLQTMCSSILGGQLSADGLSCTIPSSSQYYTELQTGITAVTSSPVQAAAQGITVAGNRITISNAVTIAASI